MSNHQNQFLAKNNNSIAKFNLTKVQTMNNIQKQFINETARTLGDAMETMKFDGSMSANDIEQVRQKIYSAKSSLSVISNVTGNTPELELFSKTADLLERSLSVVSDSDLL